MERFRTIVADREVLAVFDGNGVDRMTSSRNVSLSPSDLNPRGWGGIGLGKRFDLFEFLRRVAQRHPSPYLSVGSAPATSMSP